MTNGNNRTTWDQTFAVRAPDAGPDGSLHAHVLCDYLQDAAANHAEHLNLGASALAAEGLAWVLSRMIVEIGHAPGWQDDVHLKTWPSGREGIFATRDFLITSGGSEMARATTAWFLIDTARRRPVRLPESVTSIELPPHPRSLTDDFGRLSRLPPDASGTARTAGASEMDMNRHVNNSRYLAWVVDAMPADWTRANRPRRIEMQFKNEALAGDQVQIVSSPSEGAPLSWHYEIRRPDGGVVAQMVVDWTSRQLS